MYSCGSPGSQAYELLGSGCRSGRIRSGGRSLWSGCESKVAQLTNEAEDRSGGWAEATGACPLQCDHWLTGDCDCGSWLMSGPQQVKRGVAITAITSRHESLDITCSSSGGSSVEDAVESSWMATHPIPLLHVKSKTETHNAAEAPNWLADYHATINQLIPILLVRIGQKTSVGKLA